MLGLMTEVPGPGQEPHQDIEELKAHLQDLISKYADRTEYKDLPAEVKKISIDASIHALLLPRDSIRKETERLDEEAEKNPETIAYSHGSLKRRRKRERAKNVLGKNRVSRSILLTKIDRSLIARRNATLKFAETDIETFNGLTYREIFKDKTFIAAEELCVSIINSFSNQLDYHQQYEPTTPALSRKRRYMSNMRPYIVEYSEDVKRRNKHRKRKYGQFI